MSNGYPQAVFTKLEDSRTVLSDFKRFSSVKRSYPGTDGFYFFNSIPSVTDSDPPVHTRRRRLMAPAITPRKLLQIEAGVSDAADKLLDQIAQRGPEFDLVTDLCKPLAIQTLLGFVCNLPAEVWPIFTELSQAQRVAFSQFEVDPAGKSHYQLAWDTAETYCSDLIESRRRNPTDDLVSNMLAAQSREESQLTIKEVLATLIILFTASIGGITNTPAWTLWRLARHPEQMALLHGDPSLVNAAVIESIRMEPSSYASLRYAGGDFEFAGLNLTDAMPVHTLSAGGNYDPVRYRDPLVFDITRPTDWVNLTSFGHGVHHCIGNPVARLGARILVGKTAQRFPQLRLQQDGFMPQIEGVTKQRSPVAIPVLAH
jgi:cytochrome P450